MWENYSNGLSSQQFKPNQTLINLTELRNPKTLEAFWTIFAAKIQMIETLFPLNMNNFGTKIQIDFFARISSTWIFEQKICFWHTVFVYGKLKTYDTLT